MRKGSEEESRREEGGRVFLGLGLYVSTGDHVGHFYRSADEWKNVLVPFIEAGLKQGDQCVYLSRPSVQQVLKRALAEAGVDVEGALGSRQLILDEGKSEPEALRQWFDELVAGLSGRDRILRWAGDMTWSTAKSPTSEAVLEWETMCNMMDGPPAVFLCQYDLAQFTGSVVMDALRTHPLCIVGNVVHQNALYAKPEEFLEELRRRRDRDEAS